MGVRGSAKRRRRRAPCSSAGANTKAESRFPPISSGDGHALERKSKQRRTAAPSAGTGAGAGADLISCLGDDVLVRVLELLPDARDAVRTDALSRRWRGLWTRLPALRFASSIRPEFWSVGDGSQRYVAFVNDAVALRAAQTEPALQRLAISFTMASTRLVHRCFEAAQGWIRDAARNEVKSFVLELHLPIAFYDYHDGGNNKKAQFVVALDDLPSSAKMETMRLALDGATFRLPAAATFASLVDLSLENLEFADGGGHLLNRLLSPASCPRLRNLSMRKVRFAGLDELLLEAAEVLTELTWEGTGCRPNTVRLRTPGLCVLRMVDCDLDELTLSAPRLEELLFFGGLPISTLDVDGKLLSVRSLKFELYSHASRDHGGFDDDDDDEDMDNDDYDMNSIAIHLLNFCTAATCLDMDLYVTQKQERGIDIIEDRIPRLPQVTSLTVHVFLSDLHSFGAGIEHILAQCSNLKYLCVRCTFRMDYTSKMHFLCDHPDHWKPRHEIHLPHLEEAEFTGLVGTGCELWFIQSMLASTTQLQKATISFDAKYNQTIDRINAFKNIPMLEGGIWIGGEAYLSLEWKPYL